MVMSFKDKLLLWSIILIVLFSFIYLVSGILLPFVVAAIIAYFLNPIARKLEAKGFTRSMSAITIIGLFFIFLFIASALLLPALYDQIILLTDKIPEYVEFINHDIVPKIASHLEKISPDALDNIKNAISNMSLYILKFAGVMLSELFSSTIALLNIFSLIFITPIVTFYIIRDWETIISKVDSWLPRKHLKTYREQFKLIDMTLSGYIRGQTNVCLILGTFYAVALAIAGLDFALFIGFSTGILSFIPYVGVFFGAFVGLLIAFLQFGDLTHILIVGAIFAVGQFLEGNFITPRLIGNRVGLHDVWIIFGMLSGAAILGFVGVLISVPVTAVIGVLVRFSLKQYLNSQLYIDKKASSKKAGV